MLGAACGTSRKAKKSVKLDEVTVTAKNNPYTIYREASQKSWEIVHTRAALSFNYKERTADGRAWIKLRPYFYETDSLVLDAKGMIIDSVMLDREGASTKISSNYSDDKLSIKFDTKYIASDTIALYITYTAMPYATKSGGSAAINDDRGLYFINTDYALPGKPAQIWTQGETEANSHWLPTIDRPNQRTTVQLELTVADSFTTLSNGRLVKQLPAAKDMRTDIWVSDKPIQVYAIMFAIGKFSVVEDKQWQGKKINYYVEPEFAPYAKLMFKNTPEMMAFFSDITGVPYAWDKYSQVVVRDYVSGAMENTSATLFGEFMNQDARENKDQDFEDIVSHEIFHQWFGDYVTAESWSNLTVNESFANYGEQLWRKYKYGAVNADELWWSDLHLYLNSSSILSPLVRFHYADKEDMFDRVSYQKGGAILHYLHGLMGDEAFYKAMNLYLTRNALRPAEATHWRLAVEEVTGQDWNWFFNQWYNRGAHPRLDIKYTYDDAAQKLTVAVAQKQEGSVYKLPLKTAIVYGQEKTIVDWNITERTTTLSYPYKSGVKPVVIPDVNHWLVGEWNEDKTSADWLATFKSSGDDIISKFKALRSIKKKIDDANKEAMLDLALQDKYATVKQSALQNLESYATVKQQQKWQSDVKYLAVNDGNNKVRAAAFDVLGEWKISSAKQDMLDALGDSSYKVAGAALAALSVIDKDTAYLLAVRLMATRPRGDLEAAIWNVIGAHGKELDIALFEKEAPYYYGSKKIALANSLEAYLKNVASNNSFEKGLMVLEQMVKTEVISSYRLAVAGSLVAVAADYKEKKRTARTNPDQAQAENRLAQVKAVLDRVISNETDEGNKKTLKDYAAALFG